MIRRIIRSEDGSHTLFVPELNEHYHSTRGAWQESLHIYIQAGLMPLANTKKTINILEVGFGTGLNAFQTLVFRPGSTFIRYHCCEPFPLQEEEWLLLNFPVFIEGKNGKELFEKLHQLEWNKKAVYLCEEFLFSKSTHKIEEENLSENSFDLIYYDAFGPQTQAELWTETIFDKISRSMKSGGLLLTFSSRGSVKRALKSCGFTIEKLPGPPGKREFIRATKI